MCPTCSGPPRPHKIITYLKHHREVCLFITSPCSSRVKLVDDNVPHNAERSDIPGRCSHWEYLEIRRFMIRNIWPMVEDEEGELWSARMFAEQALSFKSALNNVLGIVWPTILSSPESLGTAAASLQSHIALQGRLT